MRGVCAGVRVLCELLVVGGLSDGGGAGGVRGERGVAAGRREDGDAKSYKMVVLLCMLERGAERWTEPVTRGR
jgi:hypothetical protein